MASEIGQLSDMKPILRAFVDETGDRGTSGKSSDFFAFACVLIADEDEPFLRAAISQLRRDFGVPVGKALHWKDHVKVFSRRQHVAKVLSAVPNVMVIYILVEKSAVPALSRLRSDHKIFYNYAAGIVMERVLLAARDFSGGPRDVILRFGHVRGFDHTTTSNYFTLRSQNRDPNWVPWERLRAPVYFDGQVNWDGLQAADQYAGMLSAAIRQDNFGNYEPHHFLQIAQQIRRVDGKAWGYGFKFLGNEITLRSLPWWAQSNI